MFSKLLKSWIVVLPLIMFVSLVVRVLFDPLTAVLIFVAILAVWFIWDLVNMNVCDTCGNTLKPWQGSAQVQSNSRDFRVHSGCPFQVT